MSERSDHLIERAAARLRENAAGAIPLPNGGGLNGQHGPDVEVFDPPMVAGPVPPAGTPLAEPGPVRVEPIAFTPIPVPAPGVRADARPAAVIELPGPDAQGPEAQGPEAQGPGEGAKAGPAPARRFEPFTLPVAPAAAAPGARASMFSSADAVPERVDGPVPAPSAPLTRPVLTQPPPSLTLNLTSRSQSGKPQPGGQANGMLLADQAPRSAGPVALQAPAVVQLDALERAGMVVARTTRTRISEEYRIAIGRILRTLHETTDVSGARNVMMVTSARPGEGKSFTALNLAGSIAQNGTDAVLLVDVDPKVKPLSAQLGLGDAQGFLDLVSDPSLRPEDLLRVTAIPNLAIMPVGTRLGGAAQTVGGTASMRPIIPTIARLARRFPKHLVMLDAPPCLSTSDPHTLAPHVGQVVLVVEAERTQRTEVEAALDLVRVCPSITLLLNKVRMTTSHTFGAYDYFGSYT